MAAVPIEPDAPFASAEQMASRTQDQITAAAYPSLDDELLAATADIRDFCRWHISPQMQVDYRHVGRYADDVWLPATQIKSVDEVTIDGRAWSADEVAAVEFDPVTGWTNLRGRAVLVKYTAGYPEVPANVVTATLELAAAALGTSLGMSRLQAGGVSAQFDRAGGGIDEGSPGGRRLVAYQIGRLP